VTAKNTQKPAPRPIFSPISTPDFQSSQVDRRQFGCGTLPHLLRSSFEISELADYKCIYVCIFWGTAQW